MFSFEILVSSLLFFNGRILEEAYTLIQEPGDRQLQNIAIVEICHGVTILNFLHAHGHGQWSAFLRHKCQNALLISAIYHISYMYTKRSYCQLWLLNSAMEGVHFSRILSYAESFQALFSIVRKAFTVQKPSSLSRNIPDCLETLQIVRKLTTKIFGQHA